MEIISSKITGKELVSKITYFKTMLKAVVDVKKRVIAIESELHSDLEAYLMENGSKQENLWGINLYPLQDKNDFIEYTSLINIRPHQDNPSMEIENPDIKKKVEEIVFELINYDS